MRHFPLDKNYATLLKSYNIETITPPVFVAYCSANAKECIKRIAQYKALTGAIIFAVSQEEQGITVDMKGEENKELPEIILGIEMVIITNLIRKATKENIIPAKIRVKKAFTNPEYEKFLGRKVEIGSKDAITFSWVDAETPFITRNESMWNFFEPEFKKQIPHSRNN